jgi:hypothetical protein
MAPACHCDDAEKSTQNRENQSLFCTVPEIFFLKIVA